MYHVTGYLLEVADQNEINTNILYTTNGTGTDDLSSLIIIVVNELEGNTKYTFKIIIINTFGNTSTQNRTFCKLLIT